MRKKRVKVYIRDAKMRFDVFGFDVHFVETDDYVLAMDHLKLRDHGDGPKDTTEAFTWNAAKGDESYIFTERNPSINTVVHECWHAVKHMLDFRGVGMENETVAYHLDHLVKYAMKFYKKEKR